MLKSRQEFNYGGSSYLRKVKKRLFQVNDEFHRISENIKEEVGVLDSKKIFFEWNEWLKRSVKKKKIS